MSRSTNDHINPDVLEHYEHLCAAHGTAPTPAQIEDIKHAAGINKDNHTERLFEHALLFFLPRSAVVFEEDTLLLGWAHQPDGTKQEIWYKLDDIKSLINYSRLSLQRGAPVGSEHRIRASHPICDDWHPSLAAICTPAIRSHPRLRYAYFAATVRMMRSNPPSPSIEDSTIGRPRLTITLEKAGASEASSYNNPILPTPRPSLTREHDGVDAGLEEDMVSNQSEVLRRSENAANNNIPTRRLRNREVFETARPTRSNHDEDSDRERKRLRRLAVVDLTDPDSEDEIKIEPAAINAPRSYQESGREDDMPVEQEIRDMLQSKRVSEIKDVLAKRSGQIPDWIEDIFKQEMKKKMARDLETIRNFF
jgi:hypothetical protein